MSTVDYAVTELSAEEQILARPVRSLWTDAMARLKRNHLAIVGLIMILFFLVISFAAPLIAPHPPLKVYRGMSQLPPVFAKVSESGVKADPRFFFGTDSIGRDVLSRVIYGGRASMLVGIIPVTVILIIGTTIGLISGYAGGWVDNLLMRLTDVVYAFPDLLFYILLMITLRETYFGRMLGGMLLLFLALAVVSWVGVARLVRSEVLAIKEKGFIEAARSVGASNSRIILRHILPNTLSPLIVWAAFSIPRMIIVEAVLGYIGIGLRLETNDNAFFISSWGGLMSTGQASITSQPWVLLTPSICVALVVLSFTFIGDGLRDAFDPRMR
ncbi:MAG: ABC transporter permease [Chloroflexi bacterium]|nr:ABC transporter permease [Chloroflexota bacterium]